MFHMSPKDLEKELYPNLDEFSAQIEKSMEETNSFIRDTRKDWEEWEKAQKKFIKKSRKRAVGSAAEEKPKKPHVTLKKEDYFPDQFRIPLNEVRLLRSWHGRK